MLMLFKHTATIVAMQYRVIDREGRRGKNDRFYELDAYDSCDTILLRTDSDRNVK